MCSINCVQIVYDVQYLTFSYYSLQGLCWVCPYRCAQLSFPVYMQVNRHADPPVCKIMDFHKEQYKRHLKEKDRSKSKVGCIVKLILFLLYQNEVDKKCCLHLISVNVGNCELSFSYELHIFVLETHWEVIHMLQELLLIFFLFWFVGGEGILIYHFGWLFQITFPPKIMR